MNLNITLIIPTYNRENSLFETLIAIDLISIDYPDEILIIYQGKLNIKSFEGKFLHIKPIFIQSAVLSITSARNLGLKRAKNEFIVFSDDDIKVERETFTNIFHLLSNNSISLVAAQDLFNLNKPKSLLGYFFFKKSFFNRKIGNYTKIFYGSFPTTISEKTNTLWAMGFFFGIKKSNSINNSIYFDEKLKSYAYGEDLDFSIRYINVSNHLYKQFAVISNKVNVYHNVSQEYRIPKKEAEYSYIANRLYFMFKFKVNFIFFLINFIVTFIESFYYLLFKRNKLKLFSLFKAYFNLKKISEGDLNYK
jgi:glycosyltransferase involved in cell wall biosynthesis